MPKMRQKPAFVDHFPGFSHSSRNPDFQRRTSFPCAPAPWIAPRPPSGPLGSTTMRRNGAPGSLVPGKTEAPEVHQKSSDIGRGILLVELIDDAEKWVQIFSVMRWEESRVKHA